MRISLQRFSSRLTASAFAAAMAIASMTANADTMYISHGVKTNDPVYPYTGFSTNEDVEGMQVAVKLTQDMLAQFVGAKMNAIHIGWAGIYQSSTPTATAFVRAGLNDENIITAEVNLSSSSGWNVATFAEPYTIQENDELIMGYEVDAKAGVYGPCTITWGSFEEGTHFIGNPAYRDEDGNIDWVDLTTPGLMDMLCPLMVVAEVSTDSEELQNRALLSKAVTPSMLPMGIPVTGGIQLQNTGSNNIESITISCAQEGQDAWTQSINLSRAIEVGSSAYLSIPVYAQGKGETTITISEVNGNANGETGEWKFTPIVIPEATSELYTRRPLVEYIASESVYQSAAYDEEIVTPAFASYADRISRINWHSTDQFQLGLADDRDEALDLILQIADNDKSKIYLPTLMLDRDMNLALEARICMTTFITPMIGILFSPFAEYAYDYALAQPTFAELEVNASVDNDVVTVNVEGDADLAVLPDGEQLMLTVVLVEDGIESDSQEFPGGTGEGSNPGHVVHNCVARHLLTDIWGAPIEFNDGKFSMSFTTELDYDNVAGNMRAVAFINRPKANGMWERSIINSAECELVSTGINQTLASATTLRPMVSGNTIMCPEGTTMSVYTSAGVLVPANGLSAGIYFVKVTAQNGASSTFKMIVK